MKQLDLIIFDCDGVLVDSEIIGINLTRALLEQHGVVIGLEAFCTHYSGLAWNELITKVREESGVNLPDTLHQTFYNALYSEFEEKLRRITGTYEVISQLDYPKCICSNSGREQLDFMLTHVGLKSLFPGSVFSAVDLGPNRGKPQPDIFLHAAAVMRAVPENTLVIEDSVHGVTAAKRAGMYVAGFTGGAHTWRDHAERLKAAGADVVIDSMYQLPAQIARPPVTD
ncbi:HAD family phosphatase [Pantoea sp. CCBC3-3-1]|uniref:HAD family hydrolase n=1 Tax=Pantoea sp. CCBC3-3-1 TaxID=2490851 RepID=UPI0011BFE10E|nr:HAD-IA family hydrolase [Pantoea sp. CCBC3-3-1]